MRPLIEYNAPLLFMPQQFQFISSTTLVVLDLMSSSTDSWSFDCVFQSSTWHQRFLVEVLDSNVDAVNGVGHAGMLRFSFSQPISFTPELILQFLADYKRRFPDSTVFAWIPIILARPFGVPQEEVQVSVELAASSGMSSTPFSGFTISIALCEVIECLG